jgi:transglutaminase-like putative cysteine protease
VKLTTGVLAAAVILWGLHNGLLLVALPLVVLIELPRWVAWRWQLSDKDFQRLADASTVGLVLLAVYQFDTRGASGIYGILLWLPVALFPLTVTQLYSTRERIDYTALFWSVRAAAARGKIPDPGGVDIRLSYLVVCVVSASGGGAYPRLLLPSAAALIAWALWSNRPRRYRRVSWIAMTAAGLVMGFLLQAATLQLRRFIEPLAMAYLEDRIAARGDPYRAYTAIGHIGKLKLSDRIVLRVKPGPSGRKPSLLHQATYQTFARNMWVSRPSRFEELRSSAEGSAWHIAEERDPMSSVSIAAYLPYGKGLLAVPAGTRLLDNLPVDGVYRNGLGALKILRGPEVVNFRAHYYPNDFVDAVPEAADLAVPKAQRELFGDLALRLELAASPDRNAVEQVRRFFSRGFTYTLNLKAPLTEAAPLADFLLRTRSGHCEYYATATVLLLRAAGIPARYATGYAVQEYSELEDLYLVRRRHAHSWALAWVNGGWRDVDTTPATWAALESADAPWWQPAYDVGSWLAFLFAEWRWEETQDEGKNWMLWLVLPLLVILLWRMARRQRVLRARASGDSASGSALRQGADSEFHAIQRRLIAAGHARPEGESTSAWLRRLAETGTLPDTDQLLGEILPLHYRYRFHPRGLAEDKRRELAARCRQWLARNPADAR